MNKIVIEFDPITLAAVQSALQLAQASAQSALALIGAQLQAQLLAEQHAAAASPAQMVEGDL